MTPKRYLWFAPHAGNFVTFRMEHRVANTLVAAGNDVLMVQCDRVLSDHCQVMSAAGVAATEVDHAKRRVCAECEFDARLGRRHASYRTVQLSELLTPGDREWVDSVVGGITPESYEAVAVGGLPVGRYATYTSILHHKLPTVVDSADAWAEYRADLRGALLVARALPALLSSYQPDYGVVYNALYPSNRVFSELIRKSGAVLLNVSGGPVIARRYSTMAVYDGIKASQTLTDSTTFRASADWGLSALEVRHVERHVAHLMSAADPWVYSAAASRRTAASIRSQLGIRLESPVATVIISSPDETRASLMVDAEFHRDPLNGYSDVNEFVTAAIELAQARPEVDFVFRLHPRLAPNKRERITSPDLAGLYELLADLPANVVVNHPSEQISLYDLVSISAAAVNQSSSAGLEFLAFGLPVVQYDPVRLGAFPRAWAMGAQRRNPAALTAALDEALASGFDLDRCVRAYRWYASMQIRSVVHLDPLDDLVAQGEDSAAAFSAPVPLAPHPLGRFLPESVKRLIVRSIQRRERADSIDASVLDPGATRMLLEAVSHATGHGEVWEAYLELPDPLAPDAERMEVLAAVRRLSRRLDLQDAPGVGALGALAVSG